MAPGNLKVSVAARGRRAVLNQLISKADAGTAKDLWALYVFVVPQKQEELNLGVIDVALKYLSVDFDPSSEFCVSGGKPHADCALAAVSVLHAVIMDHYRTENFKEAAVSRILEVTERICLWIDLFLDHRVCSTEREPSPETTSAEVYLIHAEFLFDLISFDERILDTLSLSSTFIDLLLRLWTTRERVGDSRGKLLMDPTHRRGGCPILMLLHDAMRNMDARQTLLERVITSRCRSSALANAFVERVVQARDTALDLTIGNPDPLIGYSTLMFDVLRWLTTYNYFFRRKMLSMNYITVLSESLDAISKHLKLYYRNEKGRRMLASMFGLTMGITHEALDPIRIVKNLKDLIAANYLFALARVMAAMPPSEADRIRDGGQLLHLVGRYIMFPDVLEALEGVWPALERVILDDMRNTIPPVASSWDSFGRMSFMRLKARERIGSGYLLCDNISCTKRTPWTEAGFKECSRCHTVAYCSVQCQKDDWDRFHSFECGVAALDHSRRKLSFCVYGHKNRSFQTALAAYIYNSVKKEFDESVLEENPGHAFHELIPIVDCTTLRSGYTSRSLKGGKDLWWSSSPLVAHFPDYIKRRYFTIIEEYVSGKAPPGVKYVEFIFPYNGDVLELFVKLEKNEASGEYEAVYTIPRTSRTLELPPEMYEKAKAMNMAMLDLSDKSAY